MSILAIIALITAASLGGLFVLWLVGGALLDSVLNSLVFPK